MLHYWTDSTGHAATTNRHYLELSVRSLGIGGDGLAFRVPCELFTNGASLLDVVTTACVLIRLTGSPRPT